MSALVETNLTEEEDCFCSLFRTFTQDISHILQLYQTSFLEVRLLVHGLSLLNKTGVASDHYENITPATGTSKDGSMRKPLLTLEERLVPVLVLVYSYILLSQAS